MNHGTTCKFCKKPITVEIDDDYSKLHDPLKLLPIAACNRCADLRVERRKLESKVKITAMMLALAGKHRTNELESKCRSVLDALLKQYANMIARWNYMQGMSWDEECIAVIMEHPDQWATVLKTLWQIFYDANKNRPEHAGAR